MLDPDPVAAQCARSAGWARWHGRRAGSGPAGFSINSVRIAGAFLGILIVGAVWVNVAVTLVIPRGRIGFIKVVDRLVDRLYTASGRLVRRWDRRDALLASQPVATLGLLLLIWLVGFLIGYGLLLWLPGGSFPDAFAKRAHRCSRSDSR